MPTVAKSLLTKESLALTRSRYENALEWLDSKELNIGPTRLKKYQTHYNSLIDNWGRETFQEIIENKNYASAINEIHEIIEIKDKLEELDCRQVHESLRKILSGKELYSDEAISVKPSSARDFSFELYMARYFKRAGYQLNFNTVADFNAIDANDSIFVECKRPAKEETMGKNIEKALKQAISRFIENDSRNQKGVAAIDMTHLVNPDHEFMIVHDIKTTSEKLKQSDQIYSPAIKRHFDKYGEHCLSVILHWRMPVFYVKEQSVGLYGRCYSVPIFKKSTSSENVFNRLNQKLMDSVGL